MTNIAHVSWRFQLWPSKVWIEQNKSPIPNLLLFVGLSVSILLTLVTTLAQKSRRRARELSQANYKLKTEIQEREVLETKLKASEIRFRGMAQSSPVGLFELDANELFTYVNTPMEHITGLPAEEILGTPWYQLIHEEDRPQIFSEWVLAEKETKEANGTFRVQQPDGRLIWVHLRAKFFFHDEGKITLGTLADITESIKEQKKKEQMIQELLDLKRQLETTARTDPLTGLPNRRYVHELLLREQARADRQRRGFSLLISDLDHFKKVNDTYGHTMGDHVLVEVAQALQANGRVNDTAARWGGEEFLILLPETGQEGARYTAEKLRCTVQELSFKFKDKPFKVTMSFGVGVYQPGGTIDHCIQQADVCLYAAKKAGRNRVEFGESPAAAKNVVPLKGKKKS